MLTSEMQAALENLTKAADELKALGFEFGYCFVNYGEDHFSSRLSMEENGEEAHTALDILREIALLSKAGQQYKCVEIEAPVVTPGALMNGTDDVSTLHATLQQLGAWTNRNHNDKRMVAIGETD